MRQVLPAPGRASIPSSLSDGSSVCAISSRYEELSGGAPSRSDLQTPLREGSRTRPAIGRETSWKGRNGADGEASHGMYSRRSRALDKSLCTNSVTERWEKDDIEHNAEARNALMKYDFWIPVSPISFHVASSGSSSLSIISIYRYGNAAQPHCWGISINCLSATLASTLYSPKCYLRCPRLSSGILKVQS